MAIINDRAIHSIKDQDHKTFVDLAMVLCRVYICQGNFDEALAWFGSAEYFGNVEQVDEPDYLFTKQKERKNIVDFIRNYQKLPEQYQHILLEVKNNVTRSSSDDTNEKIRRGAYQFECSLWRHQDFIECQKKVMGIIQKLEKHGAALKIKANDCLNEQMLEEAHLYNERSKAVFSLAAELVVVVNDYAFKDHSIHSFKPKALYQSLSTTIDNHLKEHSILKEHTGTKKVVYEVLSGLAWLLAPGVMLVRALVKRGSFNFKSDDLVFHANNSTEELLENNVKELKRTLFRH